MLALIDVIDRNNRPTGEKSNPEDASNRGLWHRGAHAVIYTPSGRVLVQRRSLNSFQHPGMIDIGVGGFVDSEETPEETIIREIKEETCLDVSINDLIFLGTTRYNHRWRYGKRQKTSRSITYSYAVTLPSEHNHVACQPEEVEWIGFIPFRSALWLIHRGSLKRLGQLIPLYAYYRKVVRQSYRLLKK